MLITKNKKIKGEIENYLQKGKINFDSTIDQALLWGTGCRISYVQCRVLLFMLILSVIVSCSNEDKIKIEISKYPYGKDFAFTDIEILNNELGKPIVSIDGTVCEGLSLSISHCKE